MTEVIYDTDVREKHAKFNLTVNMTLQVIGIIIGIYTFILNKDNQIISFNHDEGTLVDSGLHSSNLLRNELLKSMKAVKFRLSIGDNEVIVSNTNGLYQNSASGNNWRANLDCSDQLPALDYSTCRSRCGIVQYPQTTTSCANWNCLDLAGNKIKKLNSSIANSCTGQPITSSMFCSSEARVRVVDNLILFNNYSTAEVTGTIIELTNYVFQKSAPGVYSSEVGTITATYDVASFNTENIYQLQGLISASTTPTTPICGLLYHPDLSWDTLDQSITLKSGSKISNDLKYKYETQSISTTLGVSFGYYSFITGWSSYIIKARMFMK